MANKQRKSKAELTPEVAEYNRIAALYAEIPANKRELVDGLLWQAARHRITLNELWADLLANGRTENRTRTNGETYEAERDASKIYTATDRSYQTIIKLLNDNLPAAVNTSKLDAFLEGDG